jgi:hypothetical protein
MNIVESPLTHPPHGMPLQSLEKRRFDTLTGNPPSPLSLKRRRVNSPLFHETPAPAPLDMVQDAVPCELSERPGHSNSSGPALLY